eukprot:GSMAST32.ASY1.ANO1.530.1 assembled CDS
MQQSQSIAEHQSSTTQSPIGVGGAGSTKGTKSKKNVGGGAGSTKDTKSKKNKKKKSKTKQKKLLKIRFFPENDGGEDFRLAVKEVKALPQFIYGINQWTSVEHNGNPLFHSVLKKHIINTKILLENGAKPNISNHSGHTALHIASFYGHVEIVKLLLSNGASPDIKENQGLTPVEVANDNQEALIRNSGRRMNGTDSKGFTPLHLAVFNDSRDMVMKLLEYGANPKKSHIKYQGMTPLHLAALSGHLNILYILLQDKRMDNHLNSIDDKGNTALHYACSQGHTRSVSHVCFIFFSILNCFCVRKFVPNIFFLKYFSKIHLVRNYVSTKIRNDDGKSAYTMALDSGHTETARVLLETEQHLKQQSKDERMARKRKQGRFVIKVPLKVLLQHQKACRVGGPKGFRKEKHTTTTLLLPRLFGHFVNDDGDGAFDDGDEGPSKKKQRISTNFNTGPNSVTAIDDSGIGLQSQSLPTEKDLNAVRRSLLTIQNNPDFNTKARLSKIQNKNDSYGLIATKPIKKDELIAYYVLDLFDGRQAKHAEKVIQDYYVDIPEFLIKESEVDVVGVPHLQSVVKSGLKNDDNISFLGLFSNEPNPHESSNADLGWLENEDGKLKDVGGQVKFALYATTDIPIGIEILWCYRGLYVRDYKTSCPNDSSSPGNA